MSTIRVRRMDDNYDTSYGKGRDSYLTDIDAMLQIIKSRLLLMKTEWWENQDEGVPMWQQILGTSGNNKSLVDSIIRQRILDTQYVTGINSMVSSIDPNTRAYSFTATVNTGFGPVVVSNVQGG